MPFRIGLTLLAPDLYTAIVVASPEWKPAQKGKSRKVRNAYASQIPWTLLDELESEKYKLEVERSERLHDWNRPP